MISIFRTAAIAPGKDAAAIAFAREILAHLKKNYDVEAELLRPIDGNPQRIAWSLRYKDLAEFERARARVLGDAQYQEILGKAPGIFVAGSLNDALWQTI